MLSTVEKVLQTRTKPFGNDESSVIRVAQNSHVSFHHTTLSNIATNESIIQVSFYIFGYFCVNKFFSIGQKEFVQILMDTIL